jgi:hypothetical protein
MRTTADFQAGDVLETDTFGRIKIQAVLHWDPTLVPMRPPESQRRVKCAAKVRRPKD